MRLRTILLFFLLFIFCSVRMSFAGPESFSCPAPSAPEVQSPKETLPPTEATQPSETPPVVAPESLPPVVPPVPDAAAVEETPKETPKAPVDECGPGLAEPTGPCRLQQDGYTVNYEDVSVMQLIRFISQISDINFVFDSGDLKDIKITIVSKEATSIHDLLATLIQVLRMNGLSVVEQGKTVLIYGNRAQDQLAKVATVITDSNVKDSCDTPVVTRVFTLYNLAPEKVEVIIRPLLSKNAVVNSLTETRHLIVSDLTANVDRIAELLATLDTPNAISDVAEYQVKNADNPNVLVEYAKQILDSISKTVPGAPLQLIPQPSANKIFIVGSPFLITKTMQVLQSLDTAEISEIANLPATSIANNSFYVYKLKYRDGRMIASAIQQIGSNLQYGGLGNADLISTIYSIQWIEVNNTLVISGTQDAIDKVVQLIDDLDTAPGQVYIEVLIIDTTVANGLNFGVEWVALANEQSKLAFASGLLEDNPNQTGLQLYHGARAALANPPPTAARNGAAGTGDPPLFQGSFGFGIIGNIIRHGGNSFLTLGALINTLATEQDTKIVLNPKIMAQDTREANFFVGQNIPYQTTNTVIRDTGSVTQNIQYEDIGVQLRVTPQIGPNRIVTLDIDQAVSDIQSSSATVSTVGGSSLLLAPTTNKTLTTTRVHVPDGCFLVMSGHIRDIRTFNRTGIPCLGSLPWIGNAFGNTQDNREKRNLIMFIQPHVINNCQEAMDLTNQEGYEYNWNSHPASIRECGPPHAPECETCPARKCPTRG